MQCVAAAFLVSVPGFNASSYGELTHRWRTLSLPCYGQGELDRAWIASRNYAKEHNIDIFCVYLEESP